MLRIVEFDKYCPFCEYAHTDEDDRPCTECLAIPAREDSRRPEKYISKGKGEANGTSK